MSAAKRSALSVALLIVASIRACVANCVPSSVVVSCNRSTTPVAMSCTLATAPCRATICESWSRIKSAKFCDVSLQWAGDKMATLCCSDMTPLWTCASNRDCSESQSLRSLTLRWSSAIDCRNDAVSPLSPEHDPDVPTGNINVYAHFPSTMNSQSHDLRKVTWHSAATHNIHTYDQPVMSTVRYGNAACWEVPRS